MAEHPEESALLVRLRERKGDLVALLEKSSSHWGFEDPMYRFYHQSYKVFALQQQTLAACLSHGATTWNGSGEGATHAPGCACEAGCLCKV